MKRIITLITMAGYFLSSFLPTMGQVTTLATKQSPRENIDIPDQYSALYHELDESLREANQRYPVTKGISCPLVAPELFMAGSGFGTAAPGSQRWNDLLAILDAFRAMGINAVSVMIASPDLTFSDSVALIGFYQGLANEIHSRNMKLYIEYFDNPPFSPHAHKGWQDTPDGKKDFLKMKEKELTMIYREIKPDFLSLITEPGTMIRWSHLSFSATELANWVGEVTLRMKSTGESHNTLLGAGAGTWETDDFIIKFAQQANLDYVDIHLYALNTSVNDNAARLDTLVRKVREIRPGIMVTIGETWLYKHGIEESKTIYAEAFFRDNFSFWSPLDQQFLKLLVGIAQKENISVLAPYFSQYFFTYYTFGDPECSKLPQWPASVPVSWNKAIESIRNHQVSATGKVMSSLLDQSCQ
ncbi:MAG: hypothetical protein Q8941_02660 [Bacteroidota bacterium]|nr:hypothetical protein [Bacteroidota bacterium]